MKIDFHLHSRASHDCTSSPDAIIEWACRKRLDGLALADHDTIEGVAELTGLAAERDLLIIPAVEISAARGTHYLVYFSPELPLPTDDLELIHEVHRRGGLVGIPHPFRSENGLIYNKQKKCIYSDGEIDQILRTADLIETANAKSSDNENEDAWRLASKYLNLKAIGGSDSHHPASVGSIHTDLTLPDHTSAAAMAEVVREGVRVVVSLPERDESRTEKTLRNSAEGIRRLLIRTKPMVPRPIWKIARDLYTRETNRRTEQKVTESLRNRLEKGSPKPI